MWLRAIVTWCAILAAASVNGALREFWIIPRTGELAGQIISSAALCLVIAGMSWALARWMSLLTTADAIRVGALWFALTAAFEFGAGHYAFGRSWGSLFADYRGAGALIRLPVLLMTLLAPLLGAWSRGLFRSAA
jgi:hypothetical protein